MIPPLDYRLGWRCPLTGCYVGTGVGLGCAGCFQNCGLNGEDTMNTYCKAGLELSSDGTPPFAGYDKGQPIHADGSACFHGLRDWNGQERRKKSSWIWRTHGSCAYLGEIGKICNKCGALVADRRVALDNLKQLG
jgi:hypothetical protein